MNRDNRAIPEGWERVPDEERLRDGDVYWHPWSLKWTDYDGQYQILIASDYREGGSEVIRKKVTT